MSSYEPSKRLFLGNLAPVTTVKDVADFIKTRTRAQPQHIELAMNEEKTECRGFAHVTVEGLKKVIEAINDIPLKGQRVKAEQAKPHYSYKLLHAKQEKERKEAREKALLEERRQEEEERRKKKLLAAEGENGEHDEKGKVMKAPHTFYKGKQYYAKLASETAAKIKAERTGIRRGSTVGQKRPASSMIVSHEEAKTPEQPANKRKRGEKEPLSQKKGSEGTSPVPATPPPLSKDQRKLQGLQERLAMLKKRSA